MNILKKIIKTSINLVTVGFAGFGGFILGQYDQSDEITHLSKQLVEESRSVSSFEYEAVKLAEALDGEVPVLAVHRVGPFFEPVLSCICQRIRIAHTYVTFFAEITGKFGRDFSIAAPATIAHTKFSPAEHSRKPPLQN